mmetsp:Transcript_22625/g.31931  ORF Transcript_22625/g.31931 Transcript_22625/m.31931 type:complete len:104 (-) Transcript_22625:1145-1456(-)
MRLHLIIEENNIIDGHISITCISKGALQKIIHNTLSLKAEHFDYLSAIHALLKKLPIAYSFYHVLGYQDLSKLYADLTIQEKNECQSRRSHQRYATNTPANRI